MLPMDSMPDFLVRKSADEIFPIRNSLKEKKRLFRPDIISAVDSVTVHTYTKVVGIVRQNACLLAFCVQ
ncbi:MAG: hypothetical protein K2N73_02965, partial [Lachnospiraceae bacterium]|nr:hypothetical protein [Lachnospiraceae bacterium]